MNAFLHDVRRSPLFLHGGDCGARLRTADWSGSPLGIPDAWPDSLKAALGLVLSSSAQICLFWGPELVALYNDAFAPAIGNNHPAALGRPARFGWAALWDMLEPLLRGVQRTGIPFDSRSHLFRQQRSGFEEDTYFDVSYSPVRDGEGIPGVFCIVSDQTGRVTDERRLRTLGALSVMARSETATEAARRFVASLAGTDGADVPCALVYLRDRDRLGLAAAHGGIPDPELAEAPASPEGCGDPRLAAVARVAAGGAAEVLQASRFMRNPPGSASDRLVLLPLHAGRDVAGVLVLAANRRLPQTPDYHRFFELLASQLSAALSGVRVLAEERHRARVLEQQVAAALAEREAAEARLRQSQKMEAIGKLTGGVAHDFNNLLQVVSGNLQLLGRDVAGNARAERRIANALEGVARGARLSAQLLAFSRRQPLEPRVVRVDRLIAGLDDMLRRSLGEGIEIEVATAGGLWDTLVDPAQLENALLNLAINARDAMDAQGRLFIEAGNATLDEDQAGRHGEAAPGQYVSVAVTDTGAGMTPEVMEQAFEPFFSTKPEGKGTGLGLSMVYGFVKQSGGHVRITSAPGRGTTVRLLLPRTVEVEEVAPAVEPGPVRGGTETVLVAEDNEGVRDTVVAMLAELGYRVLKARDAAAALNLLDSGVRIDLLFTDVVMPGPMRGPELARLARERIPGLAVLFTSGYTENAIMQGGRLDPGVELLSKPYTSEALARKLRQVLAARGVAVERDVRAMRVRRRPLQLLLVEDDALIRDNSAELLAGQAHVVAQASSAEAALELLDRHGFDVLVTDLGLPGLDGVALARLALERQPGIGLVFATGEDACDEAGKALGHAVLLRKPYDEQALMRAVEAAWRA